MTKQKAKPMQTAAEIDIVRVKVADPDPDAAHRRREAMTIRHGVISFREPLVPAVVTLRDDPLGHMYHRGKDATRLGRSQYEAGLRWQRVYEAAGIGRIRSPGDIREPVDGGGIAHGGATDRQMQAHKLLAGWRAILGAQGAVLVEDVLAEKRTLRQVAQARYGGASRANVMYVGRMFRECLSTLAREMGLSS